VKYDWEKIQEALNDASYGSIAEAARDMDIPSSTMKDAIYRGDLSDDWLGNSIEGRELSVSSYGGVKKLMAQSEKPLTADQVLKLAGLDKHDWRIDKVTIREGATVSNLFRIELILSPKRPEPIYPHVSKLDVHVEETRPRNESKKDFSKKVLFITDPHFGFVEGGNGRLWTIHNRGFLADLLAVSEIVMPELIVWGGDICDFAGFSTFSKRHFYTLIV